MGMTSFDYARVTRPALRPAASWTPISALIALLLLGSAAACGSVVDVEGLPSIDDYQTWDSIETDGAAPGHGDTIRVIFFNDLAADYPGAGAYAVGTALVKEIYSKNGDGSRGSLSYIGTMRKLGERAEPPPGGGVHGGWLFTYADELGTDEIYRASCWDTCHVQAPQDGAWFRYGE